MCYACHPRAALHGIAPWGMGPRTAEQICPAGLKLGRAYVDLSVTSGRPSPVAAGTRSWWGRWCGAGVHSPAGAPAATIAFATPAAGRARVRRAATTVRIRPVAVQTAT